MQFESAKWYRRRDDEDELLEQTFRSRVFKAGIGLLAVGGVATLIGVGDFVGEEGEFAEEMLITGTSLVTIGLGIALASAIRTAHRFDNSRSQEQITIQ